jgi:hypothetical protein
MRCGTQIRDHCVMMVRRKAVVNVARRGVPTASYSCFVVAALVPGHPRLSCVIVAKTWMPGTRPGMTNSDKAAFEHEKKAGLVRARL